MTVPRSWCSGHGREGPGLHPRIRGHAVGVRAGLRAAGEGGGRGRRLSDRLPFAQYNLQPAPEPESMVAGGDIEGTADAYC